jgi:glycosyltransferase involved in cell wall biosynthesis
MAAAYPHEEPGIVLGTMSSAHATPVRVAIDARLPAGVWGGVQQVVQGIASGFSALEGDDEFLFLAGPGAEDWLAGRLGGGCRLVSVDAGFGKTRARRAYDRVSTASPRFGLVLQQAQARASSVPAVPRSDGFVESLGVHLVHFALPQAFLTTVPSIYTPHDLLHLHHPEAMTKLHVAYRDRAYRAFSAQARVVLAMTEWGRTDLVQAFELPPSQVAVVPWAPVTGSGETNGSECSLPVDLPKQFLLYPAQTWPHKNHLGLLDALAVLRERGVIVPLVCTGVLNGHFAAVRRRMETLGLGDQVRFLGYVREGELSALYAAATALVFPSRFEGWGLPVVEAFAHGLPVACSDATALPEVAGGAALLFRADAIARTWTDAALRADLVQRGRDRVALLGWDRTARILRALYRQVAGRPMTDEDRVLLAPPVLVT